MARNCPSCRDCLLAVVAGSKGRLSLCRKCGYSGPTNPHQIAFVDKSKKEE